MNQDQDSQPNKSEWEVMPEASEEQVTDSSPGGEEAAAAEEAPATPPYTGKTPGEMLREAREARNLSIQDVVTQTRITAETIRALEEDRDPPQNAWVYVRGYYRKYARSLGLSDDEVLEAHEHYVGGAPAPEPVSAEWAPQDVSPTAAMPRFVVVLIVGILLGGLLWWLVPQLSGNQEAAEAGDQPTAERSFTSGALENGEAATIGQDESADTSSSQREASSPGLSVFSGSGQDKQDSETVGTGESGAVADEEAGAAGDDKPAESTASAAATASGPLVLTFNERSWVNIVDAGNRKLLDGIVNAGERHALDGQPPFRVFLGYAPGVEVVYQGRPVDTAPHTSSNNTARFKVGEQDGAETSATP